MTAPNRDHLVGKAVRLKLRKWAAAGAPTTGIFRGQGEYGITLEVEGGGRFKYFHKEVISVTEVEPPDAEGEKVAG